MKRITTYTLPLLFGLTLLIAGWSVRSLSIGDAKPMGDRQMQNVDGTMTSLNKVKGTAGTVVIFWCNTCPWVDKYEDRVLDLAKKYMGQGFGFILVNANDQVAYPGDNLEEMKKRAAAKGYPMPYVVDKGSEMAKAFGAARTPHVYAFNAGDVLKYIGAPDDSPSDPGKVQVNYLADALDAIKAGQAVATAETKAFGCTIKFQ